MQLGLWDTLLNAAMLGLWLYVWNRDRHGVMANPYLAPFIRLAERGAAYLRPLAPRMRDDYAAGMAIAALLALRTLLASLSDSGWVLNFGLEYRLVYTHNPLSALAFSLCSPLIVIFNIWGLATLYRCRAASGFRAEDTVGRLARPFSLLNDKQRWLALAGTGAAITCMLVGAGRPAPVWAEQTTHRLLMPLAGVVSVMAAVVDLLPLIRSAMIVAVIGSLIGAFTGSQALAYGCREFTQLLLGPLRRYRLVFGMFDFTPLLLIFAIRMRVGSHIIGIYPFLKLACIRLYLWILL